ncbi:MULTISPECIES: maleylacetoacetate isomerase [Stenotrophomonas]|uniref:Maleylacetoacetate isomerase n=1 Tax=Stenotrophomonas maltophilia TaxID=40324 RepID=A0A4S2D3P1_STEMA|nr:MULTISPECIES: maleylacetoacetate isomerase [Stenotrophomonas]MBD3825316.1 maleylacetoacetate isomerase [Stenotrophomonas sp.]QIO86833.1 maleylacetoacetate isomerase [Stenotrophomonas rhizophila]TGY35846.1 maleylacetoacetate isomerase [Stenotrophomonas maltophilia]
MDRIELYSYWRSSAAYRVRIGLNLKGLPHQITPVHLVRDGGQQHTAAYAALNPQELVPTLRHGERVLQQSMAILEYLDEVFPDPALLPDDAEGRARVRALAQLVACDIHPLNNLRVMQFFSDTWSVPQPERDDWTRHWIRVGFDAMERMLVESVDTGRFCHGDIPTLADCCLVPQMYNARRFKLDLEPYPTLVRIDAACLALPAFAAAKPESQADASA